MKTIRGLMTLAGLSVVLFALAVTGAKAQQALATTNFAGSMTLPVEAQWGSITLPAGEYNLYYGSLRDGITKLVEVVGKAKGSPRGMILAVGNNRTPASKNSLVCVQEGGALVVRALELPSIGTSVQFAGPRGIQPVARNVKHNSYTQLAEAPVLIERIPVVLNAK